MPPKSKADVLAGLGMECFKKGETDKGIGYFEQALPLAEEQGEADPLVITVLMNLGVAQTVKGDLAGSQHSLERALALQEKALGPEHEELVQTLQSLIVVCSKLGDTTKAVGYMQRAGEISSRAQVAAKIEELESGPKVEEVTEDKPSAAKA